MKIGVVAGGPIYIDGYSDSSDSLQLAVSPLKIVHRLQFNWRNQMQAITTSAILSVVNSLVSSEEFAIFTSALEAGAVYTGNSLGQIL